MMFMTCSVELLMVFIGLKISSISTYIMYGFRKSQPGKLRVVHQILAALAPLPPPSSSMA